MRIYLATVSSIIFLFSHGLTAFAYNAKNTCASFDNTALQLALTQNNVPPPKNLAQIQAALGPGDQEIVPQTTYAWLHKNLVLLIITEGNKISHKVLSGNSDGSATAEKMKMVFNSLNSAASTWSIKRVQKQLGPGSITTSKIYKYKWLCNCATLTITTDKNNKLKSADIIYNASRELIKKRIGLHHPPWDQATDSLGQSFRSWHRSFGG